MSEHTQQVRLMATLSHKHPEIYELMFAIPNGGLRNARVAAQLQGEGVKPGVPDLFLAAPRGPWLGLFVEMKDEHTGKLSKDQEAWVDRLIEQRYRVVVCHGAEKALEDILSYWGIAW